MKMIVGLAFILCIGASAGEAAKSRTKDLALLHCAEGSCQPQWLAGGTFAAVLARDRQEQERIRLMGYRNVTLSASVVTLKKQVKIAFSPKVVLKPFILIEQLQDLFLAYQSQQREGIAAADGNAQAKTLPPDDPPRAKQSDNTATFLFSPYYHRLYGLHFQFLW